MKLVLIESPFAGHTERNISYVRACMRDCLKRGEAPFASHALYTQHGVLDDNDPDERKLGIDVGLLWGAKADLTAFYMDLGTSRGMEYGAVNAAKAGRVVEHRMLPDELLMQALFPFRSDSAHWPEDTRMRFFGLWLDRVGQRR